MDNDRAVRLIVLVRSQHDVHPVLKGLPSREAFQRLSSHGNHLSLGRLPEKLHILRNAHQQLVAIPNGPVLIDCNYQIHPTIPSCLFAHTATGISLICSCVS